MRISCNILHFLQRGAHVYGKRTAIIDPFLPPDDPMRHLTYEDVWRLVHAQARAFSKMGISERAKIAVLSDNSARFFISLFSISGFNRVVVPINFRLKRNEIEYILRHSDAELLLVDEKTYPLVKDIDIASMVLTKESDRDLFCDEPWAITQTDDENAAASINYTSGTTALPKGVVLTHRNLYVTSIIFAMHLAVRDGEVYLHTLPMFHCNGWGMPYILSAMGATHVIHQNCTGKTMLAAWREYGATQLNGAPTVIQRLIEAFKESPQTVPTRHPLRIVVAGAAPPVKMIEEVETVLNAEFVQLYGLTETAPLLTTCQRRYEWDHLSPHERALKLAQAGAPAVGVQIAIADDGEILAQSNGVLDAYYKDPKATHEALSGGWFHTGDNGTLSQEHYLALTDRKKDIIISGGENISSLEVENALYLHAAVKEAAVIGVYDATWGETVKALVVLHDDTVVSKEALIEHCRAHLAHFKCPRHVEFVTELPRTATGKLQKFKLRQQTS